ncbi:MAG: hypothetical protein IPM71_02820 [Bacteroidota bacterium]|nr:MAG: hypothetical protein IPM71_02820 [Bacteroidota bacterium]
MKRLLLFAMALTTSGLVFAGGIVTNTNQSAMYTCMQARDATLGIDAVYFNPAGLTLLPNNGLFLSINNQTLGQTRTITSNYASLNEGSYTGEISAPFFPGIYAAYKMDKLAFSFGFNPIGGGGGGTYEKGLPSFEYDFSDLPYKVNLLTPTTAYSADIFFEGTSVYFGYQANVSYAITEKISAALGGRYVMAKNTNKGYIRDILINPYHPVLNPNSEMISATTFFSNIGNTTAQAMTADREVDVEETASGFTPIISVNIKPNEMLNFALKYEHQTKLEFETKVNDGKDGGMFVDGEKYRYDIPAQIVVGATVIPIEKLLVSTGFHYYLDESADWSGREEQLDGNSLEFALGAEYGIGEKLLVSAGYLYTNTGATEAYQTDQSFSLPSSTVGGGLAYKFSPMIELNLAGSYTAYQEGEKNFTHNIYAPDNVTIIESTNVTETYKKPIWIAAIGININFSAGK